MTQDFNYYMDKLHQTIKNVEPKGYVKIRRDTLVKMISAVSKESAKHGEILGMQKGKQQAIEKLQKIIKGATI